MWLLGAALLIGAAFLLGRRTSEPEVTILASRGSTDSQGLDRMIAAERQNQMVQKRLTLVRQALHVGHARLQALRSRAVALQSHRTVPPTAMYDPRRETGPTPYPYTHGRWMRPASVGDAATLASRGEGYAAAL